jgi:hypothetical protein
MPTTMTIKPTAARGTNQLFLSSLVLVCEAVYVFGFRKV